MDSQSQSEDEEDREQDNSCIQVYFQVKDQTPENRLHQRCCVMLLEAILHEKAFDSLRTKEQLGYNVSCNSLNTRGVQALCFCIQSAEHSPVFLQERIFSFTKEFSEQFLTEQTFKDYKIGLISSKRKGFKDMFEESEYIVSSLKSFSTDRPLEVQWDRIDKELAYLETELTFSHVWEFY